MPLQFLTYPPFQNFLYRCRRDPRNIVLDSVQPEIAPHIVVTPPEFDWADFSTMQENAAPLQQHPECYLCVPASYPTSFLASVPAETADQEVQVDVFTTDSEEEESPNGTLSDASPPVISTQPMRVFSPSLFTGMVCLVPLLFPISQLC